jgi:hypothetical protein
LSQYAQAVAVSPVCRLIENVHVSERDVDIFDHLRTGALDRLAELDLDALHRRIERALPCRRLRSVLAWHA